MKEIKIVMTGHHPRLYIDGVEVEAVKEFTIHGSVDEITTLKMEQFCYDNSPKKPKEKQVATEIPTE